MNAHTSEGHRVLLEHMAGRSAAILARRVEAPERTVRGWLEGRVPTWRYRALLESLGLVASSLWRTPPRNSVGGSVTKGSRFSREIASKSKIVTGGEPHGA